MKSTVELSPDDIFEQWLERCSNNDQRAINDFVFYRYFWTSWTAYLETSGDRENPKKTYWTEVDGAFIKQFLDSGIEARGKGGNVSMITKRRYWRLLERVYDYAVDLGLIPVNPATALVAKEKPPSEDPKGAILLPVVWEQCFKILREGCEDSVGLKPIDLRNRALLLVLFELGLTSAEIRALTVESFVDGGGGKGASIRITSGGVNQLRTMVVSDEVRSAVKSWLQVKATAGKHALSPALFSSQTGKPMTDENLLVLVRAHLLAASRAAGQADPVRTGPQIVRNTRLVQWMLSGMPQPEVALRAGLKNVRGLVHLRLHLPDGPRLELARAASRKDDEPLRPAHA
ncbi:tyrosine-type recombinase/integrase [Acidovorax sp. 22279]|uniref:tyrosine-type recombinase/integrase n=1 Tax=Acidovorax sp. 22279 TaxID=3453900 RepID=UPI003F85B883